MSSWTHAYVMLGSPSIISTLLTLIVGFISYIIKNIYKKYKLLLKHDEDFRKDINMLEHDVDILMQQINSNYASLRDLIEVLIKISKG